MNRPAVILYRCSNHEKPRWRIEYTNSKYKSWLTFWNDNGVFSGHIEVMEVGDRKISDAEYMDCMTHYDCDKLIETKCPECLGGKVYSIYKVISE
jgi:hypothetical protein